MALIDMDEKELDTLVRAWVELHHTPDICPDYEGNVWVLESISNITIQDPELLWRFIKKILLCDVNEYILANLAAGPLEDLMVYHGDDFIERVEKLANTDKIFRRTLGGVWKSSIPEHIWNRIRAVFRLSL